MDYSIHIATISMKLSILYFKALLTKISIKLCICIHEDGFDLSKPRHLARNMYQKNNFLISQPNETVLLRTQNIC